MLVILIRTFILFIGIIITLRVLGKRQLGELEASEFVLTLLIADLASVPMQDTGTPLLHGVIPILVMVSLEMLITFGIMKNLKFRILMCGKPSIVVQNGKIIQKELNRSHLSVDELLEELRVKNITDISQVKYAILETSGDLSTILYAGFTPATSNDMKVKKPDPGLPIAVINDGKMLANNMRIRKVDMERLQSLLLAKKLPCVKDIFLMTIDELGNVYISEKEQQQ